MGLEEGCFTLLDQQKTQRGLGQAQMLHNRAPGISGTFTMRCANMCMYLLGMDPSIFGP